MKIDNNSLKDLYQQYVVLKTRSSRDTCPSSKAIVDSFKPSTSIRKKKKIVDHITGCALCKEEFFLFLELQASNSISINHLSGPILTGTSTDKANAKLSPRRLLWRYAYYLFSILLLLSSIFLLMQQKEHVDNQRSIKSVIVLVYPNSSHTYQSPLLFRWRRLPSYQHYILDLFDENLLPIWTSKKIHDVQVQLPSEILYKLNLNESYYWMITGFADSIKKGESRLARFILVRK